MWGNNGFDWLIGHRAAGNGVLNLGSTYNNKMDSWANLSNTYNGAGYDNQNGAGSCQTFHKSSNDDNVSPFNSDEVSSWKTNGGC